MGHQLTLFLSPQDTMQLEERLRSALPMVILHSRAPTQHPRIVTTLNWNEGGVPWLYFFLVRAEDVPSLVLTHVPAQGYWSLDVIRAPVVEFNRCFFDGRLLRRGRIYYREWFYDSDGCRVEKGKEFGSWARRIVTVAKRGLMRRDGDWIGADALAWLTQSGGTLAT